MLFLFKRSSQFETRVCLWTCFLVKKGWVLQIVFKPRTTLALWVDLKLCLRMLCFFLTTFMDRQKGHQLMSVRQHPGMMRIVQTLLFYELRLATCLQVEDGPQNPLEWLNLFLEEGGVDEALATSATPWNSEMEVASWQVHEAGRSRTTLMSNQILSGQQKASLQTGCRCLFCGASASSSSVARMAVLDGEELAQLTLWMDWANSENASHTKEVQLQTILWVNTTAELKEMWQNVLLRCLGGNFFFEALVWLLPRKP